jgi:hypothetical protein
VAFHPGGDPAGVTLESLRDSPTAFGVLMQSFPADGLVGELIRLEADVMTREVTGRAALWLRVDGEQGSIAFDNMADDPIAGTTGSRRVGLELAMPNGATTVHFGLLLVGTGSMTVGPLKLTIGAGD